ncbi:ATP-binding protein [Paenibacillus sp. HJGM_3]|uniref:sensor histidine kinase n=1 Tax=Paenibacillus sp. HJGM_3 TaxID=3379816 RepID=UPI003859233D
MSIRLKLLLSYAAMLVIPVVLMVVTAMLLLSAFRGDFQMIHETHWKDADRPFIENHSRERLLKELKRSTEKDPALLSDTAYLTDLDQELQQAQSNLIVRKGGAIQFVSPALEQEQLLTELPAYERSGHAEEEEPIRSGNKMYQLQHYEFTYPDQTPGSVIVVTSLDPFAQFARKFFPLLFGALIVILILTHTTLTYFVSRSIIKPLHKLKHAMARLEAGDLDYQVEATGKDEIGQLSVAFERMRKQLQLSIQTQLQYEENRKELISNISHDLRTPLTAIQGYVDGLGDGIADTPDKRARYLSIISSKTQEMDHLIDELFLYSRLDLKKLPFNFEIVEMKPFLTDWADELNFDLSKQGVHFSSEITLRPIAKASIDRDQCRRVFSNIVDNCLKYMNRPERIVRLRAFESEGYVVVRIADNGPGIEEEALPHIFERFYRAEQSRNSHTGGSGLGLAIAKQIMDGHGGWIRADSTRGEGTTITVGFPLNLDKAGDAG